MGSHAVPVLASRWPKRILPGLLALTLGGLFGCTTGLESLPPKTMPAKVPDATRVVPRLQDPAWFGEGVTFAPEPWADFAWARPDLDLRGQAVELAPWEVPAAPPTGDKATEAWKAKRDRVTQLLQQLVVEGLSLAQQVKPPPGSSPTYRLQGRVLAFDRQTRVAAKTGQVMGNIVLVPVNLILVVALNGAMHDIFLIRDVSGYHTEVLYQVKVVDLRTQSTVLALQSWLDFKSLEAPTHLRSAIWALTGGEAARRTWWPPLHAMEKKDGDQVWFKPGLDLRQARILCLPWMPEETLQAKVREKDLDRGLQATRMPGLLADPGGNMVGPWLSEAEGTLFLQGECPGPERMASLGCRVKLWDPGTGEVLGLLQVRKGFWRSNVEKDWVRRIRRHLQAQLGPSPHAGANQAP